MSSWSDSQKAVFQRQIDSCILEYKETRESGLQIQPWLFFLGQQERENLLRFRLLKNDYRLVCCLLNNSPFKEPKSQIAVPREKR
ncbi:MAG: hypothetical protein HC908_18790 [Calothrix sp. SM1_7_51]|nr:hypothetical protein [Calothrix sp. SM1_7_51]